MHAIGIMGAMERSFNRLNICRIIIIFIITVTIIIFAIGAYGPPSDAGTFWTHVPRPHQCYTKSKTHLAQSEGLIADVGDVVPSFAKPDHKPAPESTMVDGVKVSPPAPPADDHEYLAICLLVKDDPQELREFFTHHYYHHGIRRFYIYDDGSHPHLSSYDVNSAYNVPSSVLNFTYIEPESVSVEDRKQIQQNIMERCITENGPKHHWLGLTLKRRGVRTDSRFSTN